MEVRGRNVKRLHLCQVSDKRLAASDDDILQADFLKTQQARLMTYHYRPLCTRRCSNDTCSGQFPPSACVSFSNPISFYDFDCSFIVALCQILLELILQDLKTIKLSQANPILYTIARTVVEYQLDFVRAEVLAEIIAPVFLSVI